MSFRSSPNWQNSEHEYLYRKISLMNHNNDLKLQVDQLILTLKVISKVGVGQYLVFKNDQVQIRKYYPLITPIIRSLALESRQDVTTGLQQLLERLHRFIEDFREYQQLIEGGQSWNAHLRKLQVEINNTFRVSDEGLNALIKTYRKDAVCTSRIEQIRDQLGSLVDQIDTLLV